MIEPDTCRQYASACESMAAAAGPSRLRLALFKVARTWKLLAGQMERAEAIRAFVESAQNMSGGGALPGGSFQVTAQDREPVTASSRSDPRRDN